MSNFNVIPECCKVCAINSACTKSYVDGTLCEEALNELNVFINKYVYESDKLTKEEYKETVDLIVLYKLDNYLTDKIKEKIKTQLENDSKYDGSSLILNGDDD